MSSLLKSKLTHYPPIHKDPFDRILPAQAIVEGLALVSKEEILRQYPVTVIW